VFKSYRDLDLDSETIGSLQRREQILWWWVKFFQQTGTALAFISPLWVLVMGFAIFYFDDIGSPHRWSQFWFLFWLMIAPVLAAFTGALLLQLAHSIGDRSLKLVRAERLSRLVRIERRPPLLLLRSFVQNSLWYAHRETRDSKGLVMHRLKEFSLERLSAAASVHGPVLSVGAGPMALFGPLIDVVFLPISVAPWQPLVACLMRASRVIFIIPGTTGGVLEEFSLLQDSDAISKTIVYMPPSTRHFVFRTWDEWRLMLHWENVRSNCRQHGWALPEYAPHGLLYAPNDDFSVRVGVSLCGRAGTQNLSKGITTLLPHLGTNGVRPASEVMIDLDRIYGKQVPHWPRIPNNQKVARDRPDGVRGRVIVSATVIAIRQFTGSDGTAVGQPVVCFIGPDGTAVNVCCPTRQQYEIGARVEVTYVTDPLDARIIT
jgi:hypothetical protein